MEITERVLVIAGGTSSTEGPERCNLGPDKVQLKAARGRGRRTQSVDHSRRQSAAGCDRSFHDTWMDWWEAQSLQVERGESTPYCSVPPKSGSSSTE